MRIVFFGTGELAVPSLRHLVECGHQIVRCITQPDRPQGRGLAFAPSPVKQAAAPLGVPLQTVTDWSIVLADVQAAAPEVGIAIDYGRILPSTLLRVPRHGFFGVHPSLLPKYRGSTPVASAILHGEHETGVTVFQLNERMDAGDIAGQAAVPIGPEDTTETLTPTLAARGAALLGQALEQLACGSLQCRPQDEHAATITPKFTKADGRLDWTQPAVALDRRVHALQPWPGAWTTWRGGILKIFMTHPVEPRTTEAPGRVVAADAQGIVVSTGQGALRLEQLQAAGRRRMSAREFLAGHRIDVGEILGA